MLPAERLFCCSSAPFHFRLPFHSPSLHVPAERRDAPPFFTPCRHAAAAAAAAPSRALIFRHAAAEASSEDGLLFASLLSLLLHDIFADAAASRVPPISVPFFISRFAATPASYLIFRRCRRRRHIEFFAAIY